VGKLLNWLNLGRILLFWDLNYNILTSNITDAAGSAAAQPGHVIGKSAARPIVIAWLVASGEFSCCLAVAVATRPPIGDVCILSACDAGQLLLTIFLLGDDYCPIGNSPRLPRAMLFASVPSVRCARLHGPPVGGYGQW